MKDARLEVPLKDCPFCGGPAETDSQRTYRSIEGKLGKAVAVYCTGSCSADMTLCLADVPGSAWEDLLAALIENWNRRIPDPRIAEWEKSCTGKHGSQMQCVGSVSETEVPHTAHCVNRIEDIGCDCGSGHKPDCQLATAVCTCGADAPASPVKSTGEST